MERPTGSTVEDESARRKYDAWKSEEGLSKTEAKRRYISYLIDTMKTYASGTHEARELLGELEYLWDQIKDVIPSPSPPMTPIPQLMGGNSLGGSLYGDSFLDDRSGFLHNSSIKYHHPSIGDGNNSYLSRDIAALKKDVSVALRRINDELNQINNKKNDGSCNKKLPSGKGILENKILRKIGGILLKILGGVVKRFIIDIIVLISVIKFIKFKNGLDINFLNGKTSGGVGESGNVGGEQGLFTRFLFTIFRWLNRVNLVSFNRLYIEID